MGNVSDRFLGYAFSAGDLLVETDESFNIVNADGAVSLLGISDPEQAKELGLAQFVGSQDQSMMEGFEAALNGKSRLGPMRINMGPDPISRRPLMVCVARIPGFANRYFFAISLPYKMGLSAESVGAEAPNEAHTQAFLDRVDQLLTSPNQELEGLAITLLEAIGTTSADSDALKEVERQMQAFSLGGGYAARLADDRFAAVFHEDSSGTQSSLLMYQLSQTVGLNLTTTSLDAAAIAEQGEDGRRAAVYTLRNFADCESSYDVKTLSSGYRELIEETAEKVATFRDIIDHQKFSLVYQPIVRLSTGAVICHEALARFDGTALEGQQGESITFAEKVGMIPEFDLSVLKSTLAHLKTFSEADRPVLSVNVSAKSLASAFYTQKILDSLADHMEMTQFLTLEVTESSVIVDIDGLGSTIGDIQSSGFRVLLDDFGTSSDAFEVLRQVQVDGVKIDGAVIRDAATNTRSRAFLRAMASLCKDLEIETIAEWIQDESQLGMLSGIGIDCGQGYYFGKPSPDLVSI